MAKVSPAINSFNAGELSPLMDARQDFAKYGNGCARLENFLPLVEGPVVRRGGTKYISEVYDSSKRSWLLRFMFNATEAYVMEFGVGQVRLFTDRGTITAPAYNGATTYEIGNYVTSASVVYHCIAETTGNAPPNATYWRTCGSAVLDLPLPYIEADMIGPNGECPIRIAQTGDVLYVTNINGGYMPLKVERYSDTRWIIYKWMSAASGGYQPWFTVGGPFADENTEITYVHAQIQTDQEPGSLIVLSSTLGATFTGYENTLFRISERDLNTVSQWKQGEAIVAGNVRRFNGVNYEALNNATTGNTPPTHDYGAQYDGQPGVQWEYLDNGEGTAFITSVNAAATVNVTNAANNGAGLIRLTSAGHGLAEGYYVIVASVGGVPNATGNWYVSYVDANNIDLIGSTWGGAYTAGGTITSPAGIRANAIIQTRIPDTACSYVNRTTRWALSAFKASSAPEHVCFFRERLTFVRGQDIHCSVSGDFENFADKDALGLVVRDRAVKATITADQADSVAWVSAINAGLLIGTAGGESIFTELTTAEAFGPGNVQVIPHTAHGGRSVNAVRVGDRSFFVQRSGKKLRDAGYALDGGFSSVDMSVLNREILLGQVIDMAYQAEPHQVLWVATADGGLRSLTLNTEQEVIAWARHPVGGVFGSGSAIVESVCVVPSPTNDRDDLYLIVKRTINGATKRYIEVMLPEVESDDDFDSAYYVDCGLTYDGAATTTVTGLSHLNGQTVQVLADGYTHPDCTVSAGSITLSRSASVVHVGLRYDSLLKTMRIEAGAQDGTAQGKTKRISRLVARLYNTLGGYVGPDTSNLDELQFGNPPSGWFTGDKAIQFPLTPDYRTDGYIVVKQTQPLPMTVVGLFPQLVTNDRG